MPKVQSCGCCNRFDQPVARQKLCKHGSTHTHAVNNTAEMFSMWSAPRNNRFLLLGNGAVNIPSQQNISGGVFYVVCTVSL
jgi:hypothetical protein